MSCLTPSKHVQKEQMITRLFQIQTNQRSTEQVMLPAMAHPVVNMPVNHQHSPGALGNFRFAITLPPTVPESRLVPRNLHL